MARKKKVEKSDLEIMKEMEKEEKNLYDPEEEMEAMFEDDEELDGILDDIINFLDPEQAKIDLAGLASLSKQTKESAATVSRNQLRLIVDNYYQTQQHRINIASQMRAVNQGFDDVQEGETPAIAWLFADVKNRENQIKLMIQEYTKGQPVCRWAMDIKGIGPVFAANLWAYINMDRCNHATQFLTYAGQNDNVVIWLGREKAKNLVDSVYKELGLDDKAPCNDDVFLRVSIGAKRSLASIKRGFYSHKGKETKKVNDKTIMINFMAKPPYNKELKKVCYLIGESFVKVSNRGSLYGELYKERKALETYKNERLEYKAQCDKLLSEKNYKKDTDTYKYLSQGKLSPAHINMRAKRYAVKIFLTHFFEACYIHKYKKNPPVIYPIAHMGHVDYIKPEVPYEKHFTWDKNS